MKKTIILPAIFLISFASYAQLELVDGTDLYVVPGSSLYIASDIKSNNATIWNFGTIDLRGNLINNAGSLIEPGSNGIFSFSGTTLQEISGNHDVGFYGTTEINNTNGVALTNSHTGSNQSIYGALVFTSGKITLNEFDLQLGVLDPVGYSSDHYLQTNSSGQLRRLVPADGSTNIFPVGNTSYNPISLQNNTTATTDIYGVRVTDEEPAALSTPHFVDRSWIITEEVSGGSALTVIPQWNSGEELAPFNRDLCAAGWVSDQGPMYDWKAYDAALGTDPFTRAGNEFTEAGIFTVADIDAGNMPPVAICQDVTASANENCEALVSAEQVNNGSYDPNGDPIILDLYPPGPYPLGETFVTLTVTDDELVSDACTAIITVMDETPPLIMTNEVSMEFLIWPPNHKYESFLVGDFVLSVSDNCTTVNPDEVYILKATSDEAEDAEGDGDGTTIDDIIIADDCKSIQLRKERQGDGNGRVYTIYLELDDGHGNIGSAISQVQVPHNNGETAIDDGPVYEVSGICGNKSSFIAASDNEIADADLLIYPNPFRTSATICFSINKSQMTTISVYNSMGVEVEILYHGLAEAGHEYNLILNGSGLQKGMYLVHLQGGRDINKIRKLILSK